MTRDRIQARLPKGWLAAAVAATIAMLAWLAWHAWTSLATLQRMQASHEEAAILHDTVVRLRADLQRTIQVGIATGNMSLLAQHAVTERALRRTIEDLLVVQQREEERASLHDAIAAIDRLSVLEGMAISMAESEHSDDALALVTGDEYASNTAALTGALERFDDSYHQWGLERSVGLTRQEVLSLAGAFALFALVIGAWLVLILRLQRERKTLVHEMDRRSQAEAQLLRSQKNEVLGQLSGGVAHDVDNVLSAAAGYAALARRAQEPASRQLALDGLDKAVAQGRGLTRNLLSFTRQESSVRRPVELTGLILDTQSWLAPLLPATIRLEVHANSGKELWVDADPVQLQQAFANLALNARDAMPEGGTLKVSLCRRPAEVLADAAHFQWAACLSITDDGCGMDSETLARAREPLFTTKPAGHGTGLGLTAVVRIIESHGGQVEISSSPGTGTQVRMLLPAGERNPEAVPTGQFGSRSPARAVVISGDEYSRELLVATLEDAGLDVRVPAAASQLAGTHASDEPPDVFVVEWAGDEEGALELVRQICAHNRRIPIILIADTSDPAHEAELAELAFVVARPAPLGELGALACRLSEVVPAEALA